ncbi:hypothetical protein [Rubrivirga sp. IMCC43871]|uniref:hypothetical protein n=1 Tax=Rubrivirga sp. IMCC43871 TaxID=3391575 RepID=UPI00398FF510
MRPTDSLNPLAPNLPSERLVLAIGSAVAAGAYAVWTVDAGGWSLDAAVRAGGVLAAVLVLALVLRAVRRANRPR